MKQSQIKDESQEKKKSFLVIYMMHIAQLCGINSQYSQFEFCCISFQMCNSKMYWKSMIVNRTVLPNLAFRTKNQMH